MKISVKVDAGHTEAEFRNIRRNIGKVVKSGLQAAAQRVALPHIQRLAPSVVRSVLTARATKRQAYITTRGKAETDRIAGLLNFGGLVTTHIFPKDKQALKVASNVVVAAVHRPRSYTGKHFIERGMETAMPGMEGAILEEVNSAFAGLGGVKG